MMMMMIIIILIMTTATLIIISLFFSLFDRTICRYEVYKVETIRDSYMVVSGLPMRIDNHAAEIAHMSCALMQSASDIIIGHLPEERIRLRIGLHTGFGKI
jgi:class 3 adenylate cyclase